MKWSLKIPRVGWERVRNWFFLSLAFMLVGSFVVFTRAVFGEDANEWNAIDREVMLQVAALRTPVLNGAVTDITALASSAVLSMLCMLMLILFWFSRNRVGFVHALSLFVGTMVLQTWAKDLFERERPSIVPHLVEVFSSSYPSGHAFAASSIYLTLALMASKKFQRKRERLVLFSFATLVIVLVAFSRVYLGVHYPSDVLAGACIGAAWAFFLAAIVTRFTSPR